jgi:hypothetical protein
MFRLLLAHLQEALHKRHLVYFVRVMPVTFKLIEEELVLDSCTSMLVQPTDITHTHTHTHTHTIYQLPLV